MIKKQVGVAAVVFALTGTLGVAPAFAKSDVKGDDKGQVCPSNVEGYGLKVDVEGKIDIIDFEAPVGFLIAGYCVKAGSVNQGLGPVFFPFNPPVVKVKIDYPGKDSISHYSVKLVKVTVDPVVPVQPADRTVRTVLYSDIECVDGWVEDVVQVETFSTRYNSDTNLWVEYSAGVTEVRENNRPPTVEQCEPVVPDPVVELPVEPVVPVVPEPTPEPVVPVEPEPVVPVVPALEPVVQPTPVDAVPTVATPKTLAVTGSTNTVPAMLLALLLTFTGLAAVLFGKREKGIR